MVRRTDTTSFNWAASHPRFGSVVHTICFGLIAYDEDASEREKYKAMIVQGSNKRLSLLEFAMTQGADPHVVAPITCNSRQCWQGGEGEVTEGVRFAGKTAIECLLSTKAVVAQAKGDWEEELETIDRALDIVSRPLSSRDCTRVPVCERVVDTWATVMADSASADVVIYTRPEDCQPTYYSAVSAVGAACAAGSFAGQVNAHSNVLRAASPVLSAMLSQVRMREGARREITLEDCSIEAVQVLVSLIYTASLPADEAEPEVSTLLEALALAHRWQVQHVVEILAQAVAKRLDDVHDFEAATETALQLNLAELLAACRAFIVAHGHHMRARLRGKGFRLPAVRAEVARALGCEDPDAGVAGGGRKRRRTL